MSTDISTNAVVLSGGRYIRLPGVNSGQQIIEDFADYVLRVRTEKRLSQRDVANNSGSKISKGYIGQIETRDVLGPSVTPQKLRALALGLDEKPEVVIAKALGKSVEPMKPHDFRSALEALGIEHYQRHGGIENLTDDDRAEIVANLEGMIEQKLIRKQKAGGNNGQKK